MDKKIQRMDFQNQRNKIRQKLKKGDSATLWEAVNIAKGNPSYSIPEIIEAETGQTFLGDERPQAFADYNEDKVKNIALSTKIPENPDVGSKRMTVENAFFLFTQKSLANHDVTEK
jgi:hypothetical protein